MKNYKPIKLPQYSTVVRLETDVLIDTKDYMQFTSAGGKLQTNGFVCHIQNLKIQLK